MNTSKFLTFLTAGALLLASSSPISATNDSIPTPEQRIEKSAKEIAAESIELAATAVKQAKENTNNVKAYVDSRLDDTIIAGGEPVIITSSSDDYIDEYNLKSDFVNSSIGQSLMFARTVLKMGALFVTIIVVIALLVSYLKRRQKYKVIEKAIENNYPLPAGFLGKDARPTTIQHIHYTQEVPNNGQQAKNGVNTVPNAKGIKTVTEFDVSDWANFRSGIKWCAWGLAFFIFFFIEEASLSAFALIPIIIGAGKLYACYKIQNAIDNARSYSEPKKGEEHDNATPPPFNSYPDSENHI